MSLFSEDWLKSAQDDSFAKFERSLFENKEALYFCYIQRYNYLYRKEVTNMPTSLEDKLSRLIHEIKEIKKDLILHPSSTVIG